LPGFSWPSHSSAAPSPSRWSARSYRASSSAATSPRGTTTSWCLIFLTAGVLYAVLLGFLVVAMWESYDGARANVSEEASLLVPMYRQSEDITPSQGTAMRELIRLYAEDATNGWSSFQATGANTPKAKHDVNRVIKLYGTLKPTTKVEEFVTQQFLQTFSQVLLDRNKRLLEATESLSWIMWLTAIGGGMVTVAMSFVLYMDKPWPQMIMTSVLAALIGLLLFITAVFDHPFQGPLAISAEPFESSLKLFDQIDADFR
jgi:hypothetical protein